MPFQSLKPQLGSIPDLYPRYSAPAPPVVNTPEIVAGAFEKINKVIEANSPFEKQKRKLQAMMLDRQEKMFADYEVNPDKYEIGANGMIRPVDKLSPLEEYFQTHRAAKYRREEKEWEQEAKAGDPIGFLRTNAHKAREGAGISKPEANKGRINYNAPNDPLKNPFSDTPNPFSGSMQIRQPTL